MVELRVDPNLARGAQRARQTGRDAHGHDAGHARPDADRVDLRHVRQGPHPAQQHGIRQEQGIAPRENHLADTGVGRDVGRRAGPARRRRREQIGRVEPVFARAMTAARGAAPGDHEQHAIGEPVHQAGNRCVRRFLKGIFLCVGAQAHHLASVGHPLPPDGIERVRPVGQRKIVGRHDNRVAQGGTHRGLVRQHAEARQVDGPEGIALLPVRVAPQPRRAAARLQPALEVGRRREPSRGLAPRRRPRASRAGHGVTSGYPMPRAGHPQALASATSHLTTLALSSSWRICRMPPFWSRRSRNFSRVRFFSPCMVW